MIKTNFYPLRTIVGPSIPTASVFVVPKLNDSLTVQVRRHPGIDPANPDVDPVTQGIYDAVQDPYYSNFLPNIIKDEIRYRPMVGMDTMPVSQTSALPVELTSAIPLLEVFSNPPDLPFPATDAVASIFGFQTKDFAEVQVGILPVLPNHQRIKAFRSGQDETYSFLISLKKNVLVGGICFSGYPFISSRIENTPEGMTIGNFGLPREIRLTPLPPVQGKKDPDEFIGFQRSQFIDAEYAYTRQEIVSHSGLNYLTIDPVRTNMFMLTLTDLPFIPKIIDLDATSGDPNNPLLIKGFKGFAIPYLYFFEYKEQTKRPARLHAGLLGVKAEYPEYPPVDGDDSADRIFRQAFPESEFGFFDSEVSDTVTGVVRDSSGATMSDVVVTLQRTRQRVVTDLTGSFTFSDLRPDDILIVTVAPYGRTEIPIRGRANLEIQLPYTESEAPLEPVYCAFSAHSALGQRRQFSYPYPYAASELTSRFKELWNRYRTDGLHESFVSHLLRPNEKITLYLQQGEEMDRCVAGLKAIFLLIPGDDFTERLAEHLANTFGVGIANGVLAQDERSFVEDALALIAALPPQIDFCERIGVKVYELDPIEGVSPAAVELGSKYSTLLGDMTVDDFADVIFSQAIKGIPFRRSSTAKYFALELTNKGRANGQIAIHSLQLMRSAHVAVQPRAAKTQQLKAMHYRLIGPDLADDFSRLGNEGFNFSIDRLVAGQTKSVLYSAMSLLDLLHTGNARLQSNVRRRATEFEMVENFKEVPEKIPKYEVNKFSADDFSRDNEDRRTTNGWRRTESGQDVTWDRDDETPADHPSVRTVERNGLRTTEKQSAFDTYGTTESRVHSELLFPDIGDVDWATISVLGNLFKVFTDPAIDLIEVLDKFKDGGGGINDIKELVARLSPADLLIKSYRSSAFGNADQDQLVKGSEKFWRGIDTSTGNLAVKGLVSSSQSPIGVSAIAGDLVGDVITSLDNLSNALDEIKKILRAGNLTKIEDFDFTKLGDLDFTRLDDLARELSGFFDLAMLPVFATSVGQLLPLLNGLSLGVTTGVGVNISSGPNLIYPSYQMVSQSGSTGAISKSASKTGYSYSQTLNVGHDQSTLGKSEVKRIVTRRELLNRDHERTRGAEVMWQDKIQDIVTGTIPLNFTLPATATQLNYRTADETLRVRFNSGFSPSVQVDFWFELTEETIRDDN